MFILLTPANENAHLSTQLISPTPALISVRVCVCVFWLEYLLCISMFGMTNDDVLEFCLMRRINLQHTPLDMLLPPSLHILVLVRTYIPLYVNTLMLALKRSFI